MNFIGSHAAVVLWETHGKTHAASPIEPKLHEDTILSQLKGVAQGRHAYVDKVLRVCPEAFFFWILNVVEQNRSQQAFLQA